MDNFELAEEQLQLRQRAVTRPRSSGTRRKESTLAAVGVVAAVLAPEKGAEASPDGG